MVRRRWPSDWWHHIAIGAIAVELADSFIRGIFVAMVMSGLWSQR